MHTLEAILCMGLGGVHPHHAKTLCRRFVILAFPFSKRVQIGQMKQQSYNRSWLCKVPPEAGRGCARTMQGKKLGRGCLMNGSVEQEDTQNGKDGVQFCARSGAALYYRGVATENHSRRSHWNWRNRLASPRGRLRNTTHLVLISVTLPV